MRLISTIVIVTIMLVNTGHAFEKLRVKTTSVYPADGATIVAYTVTNASDLALALVRINCAVSDQVGSVIDSASDVTEHLAAGQTATGQAYFNSDVFSPGIKVSCIVDQAYQ